ncbi:DUF6474 family protein [Rhodococcus maanshanensis]|uniref:Uncharacterized protein n=1 Tax=Rhodococcus maanshanensis TaxID=183556 RepID=A0A1H7W404_9NOCA|nr:DUF6474 family protein [Rhodococcus maanshanensis]SEM15785.1 hypothetical protein SAMN05444583_12456 [Rhodococcus maanshanensis]
MGLFRKRKTRATRRAEAKALKHKAKVEAKLGARNDRKKMRTEAKSAKKVEKAQLATLKAQEKAATRGKLSVGQVRKYLGIARLLTPVLAPLVYRGATVLRAQLDQQRANKMGIAAEELGTYTGHGAHLSARIAGAERSANAIAAQYPDPETTRFTGAVLGRLAELNTAVRAAEQMPVQRRRAAHHAISAELDGVEADLLARLGVR